MKKTLALVLILSGCALTGPGPDLRAPEGMLHPMPRPGASGSAPPADASTAEAFDTTTAAERAAASTTPTTGTRLGETVASLGNPADPGFWLETPLVSQIRQGRVVAANGASATLELRPITGPAGAGSRISLPALRLLGLDLTGLHSLTVFGL